MQTQTQTTQSQLQQILLGQNCTTDLILLACICVCNFRLFSFCLFCLNFLTMCIFLQMFVVLKTRSNGMSMIFLYLLAICPFLWCTLTYAVFYTM